MSIQATITKNTTIAHNIHKIEASIDPSTPLKFEAGQFTMVNIPHGESTVPRAFSFGNINTSTVVWYVKILEDEETGPHYASPYFKNCTPGNKLTIEQPSGRMTLPEQLPEKIVYVATTTGIAPFLSHLEKITQINPEQHIEVIFGCRNREDIFAQEEIELLQKKLLNLTLTLSLSKPTDEWGGAKGRTTEHLDNIPNDALVYLCGNKFMIIDARKKLTAQGHDPQKIKFEIFY